MKAICYSFIGGRINQEDNLLFDSKILTSDIQKQMVDKRIVSYSADEINGLGVFAVSDGMGGHNCGELASSICVERLQALALRLTDNMSMEQIASILQKEISNINQEVIDRSMANTFARGMGATLVILVVSENGALILNIGDSRAYYLHQNRLLQITVDHTEGERLLKLGVLSAEEVKDFPARKNLNRYIGYNQQGMVLKADEYYLDSFDGVIMLCSDGVSDYFTKQQLRDILYSYNDIKKAGKYIIQQLAGVNDCDNSTLILVAGRGC